MNSEFFDFEVFQLHQNNQYTTEKCENATVSVVSYKSDYENHDVLIKNICAAIERPIGQDTNVLTLESDADFNLTSSLDQSVKWVLVFGVNPARLGLNASFKAYHFYPTESYNILFAHSLQKLDGHKPYKAALWGVLQNTFKKSE
ncbi:MAG: hypothetical protein HKN67_04545 [Saprospiraceae bacterium]|nr:hypothetical protein [Saprospiraceae bacterium]